mmetsp:Transcript_123500/g.354831  ORF Transcript_123500/g.354831 Transcript_123500/m.354831 type:complete len:245 (+) Transcript_123500:210-944(+)
MSPTRSVTEPGDEKSALRGGSHAALGRCRACACPSQQNPRPLRSSVAGAGEPASTPGKFVGALGVSGRRVLPPKSWPSNCRNIRSPAPRSAPYGGPAATTACDRHRPSAGGAGARCNRGYEAAAAPVDDAAAAAALCNGRRRSSKRGPNAAARRVISPWSCAVFACTAIKPLAVQTRFSQRTCLCSYATAFLMLAFAKELFTGNAPRARGSTAASVLSTRFSCGAGEDTTSGFFFCMSLFRVSQ